MVGRDGQLGRDDVAHGIEEEPVERAVAVEGHLARAALQDRGRAVVHRGPPGELVGPEKAGELGADDVAEAEGVVDGALIDEDAGVARRLRVGQGDETVEVVARDDASDPPPG